MTAQEQGIGERFGQAATSFKRLQKNDMTENHEPTFRHALAGQWWASSDLHSVARAVQRLGPCSWQRGNADGAKWFLAVQ